MSLLVELRRRNVIRVGLAYVVAGWLLVQVLEIAADSFEAPAWVMKFAITVIAVGLLPTLIFSWVYEITPEGIKREVEVDRSESITAATGRKLNIAVIVLLLLAIGLFAVDRFLVGPRGEQPAPAQVSAPAEPAPKAERAPGHESRTVEAPASARAPNEPAAPGERDASVAVLPFTTRSANDDDRYFSDGVHDDLLTQLAKIGSLKVISRTSVMDYRDTTKRIPEIADELGVATIVEGAVQRSGSKVRITAQLIDARTDEHLWAESYDRELTADTLFEIQTEIATAIAGALQATLSPEEQAALQRRLTDDLPAREAYLRARWHLYSLSVESLEAARREIQFAIERDPEFAAAWGLLGQVEAGFYWWGADRSPARLSAAIDAIRMGRSIDPDLPELDIAEGYYHYWGFLDYTAALQLLEPLLPVYPNDAELQRVVAFVNRRYGQFDKTIQLLERALELDPRSGITMAELGHTHLRLGNYGETERYARLLEETIPDDSQSVWLRGMLAVQRDGDPARAAEYWESISGELSFADDLLWWTQLAGGDFEAARETAQAAEFGNLMSGPFPMNSDIAAGLTARLAGNQEAARPLLATGLDKIRKRQASEQLQVSFTECWAYGAMGDVAATRRSCEASLAGLPPDALEKPRWTTALAGGYAMAGLDDRAFEILQSVVSLPTAPGKVRLGLEPMLKALQDDPRWEKLIAEAGVRTDPGGPQAGVRSHAGRVHHRRDRKAAEHRGHRALAGGGGALRCGPVPRHGGPANPGRASAGSPDRQ
ncbi:MAG: hypothetical protein P8102_03625 [Gammaproteobacteria bacterium]